MPQVTLREKLNNEISNPLEQMGLLAEIMDYGPQSLVGASEQLVANDKVQAKCNPSGAQDVFLPLAGDMLSRYVWVKNISANVVTLKSHADDLAASKGEIDGAATKTLAQWKTVLLGSDGDNWDIVLAF